MPHVEVDGKKIFYTAGGLLTNRILLAIHGSGGDHTHWPDELFNLTGIGVCAVDLPGHGLSGGDGYDSVKDYADFIELFVSQLDLTRVTLMGHSLGGAIVQTLALRSSPWLSRIILVGTGARLKVAPEILNGLFTNFETTIDLICDWEYSPSAPKALVDKGRTGLLNTPPEVTHGDYSACDQFDIMEKVKDIRLPAQIVSATEDRLTPVKYGTYLHRHIADSKFIVIEDAGHMMAVEKAAEFTTAVSAFLDL